MKKEKIKESDMYVPLKEYFENIGGEVFSEVVVRGRRADMVIKLDGKIIIVEMKVTPGLKLLEQAFKWKGYANETYIAIPFNKNGINPYISHCLKRDNIGLLEVDLQKWRYIPDPKVYKEKKPEAYNSRLRVNWDNILLEEHKHTLAAGSSGGGYVTDYKITMKKVRDFLEKVGDWVTTDEIIKNVETHYASPKGSLRTALMEYESHWCRTKLIKGRRCFRIRK